VPLVAITLARLRPIAARIPRRAPSRAAHRRTIGTASASLLREKPECAARGVAHLARNPRDHRRGHLHCNPPIAANRRDSMHTGTTSHEYQMLQSHPRGLAFDEVALHACLNACLECAAACNTCADACSAEADPALLVRCIRLNHDCSDLCAAVSRILGRQSEPSQSIVQAAIDACAKACAECAEECERHAAHMKHCEICADMCRTCADACKRLFAAKAKA
jgi:hypothetical protein